MQVTYINYSCKILKDNDIVVAKITHFGFVFLFYPLLYPISFPFS